MIFRSKFPSKCIVCDAPISVGEMLSWDPQTRKTSHARCSDEGRRALEQVEASRATDAEISIPCPEGRAYMPFQRAGIAYATSRRGTIFGDEMGLGKTVQAIGLANTLPPDAKILVVCPKSLVLNWQHELRGWLVNCPAQILCDKTWKDTEARQSRVAVMSYEQLQKHLPELSTIHWDLVIGDESQAFKNHRTKRAKAFATVAKSAGKVALLSGTPIDNRPIELYSQLQLVTPGKWGSVIKFGQRYCNGYQGKYGWDFTGASNLAELQDRLRATCMVRRLKRDVLTELPPKRRQVVLLDPGDAAEVLAAQEDLLAGLDFEPNEPGKTIKDASSLTYLNRVGFTEMSAIRHEIGLAKVWAVVEHCELALESAQKLILFAHHQDVAEQLAAALSGYGSTFIHGATSTDARQAAVDRFQTDPNYRVFVATIDAAGVGLTLTAASLVIFAEMPWSPSKMAQAEDRAHRIGQKECVQIQYLVHDGSLDARIAQVLAAKADIADKALDAEAVIVPYVETEARKRLREVAATIKPDIAKAVHQALRQLAGVCDMANVRDSAGFNKLDAPLGHRLARLPELDPMQAALGLKIVKKYHRQIGKIA